MKYSQQFIQKFLSKIEFIPFHNCWEWTACRNESGYGICGIGNKKIDRSHRISYRIFKGEIPPKMFVCHQCDNPGCLNPNHLFLGNNQDNVNDMIAKNRNSKPPFMGGWNRISYSEEILNLLGKQSDISIAKKVGVSKYAIAGERKRRGIPAMECQTKFRIGQPHPRWSKKGG